MAYIQFVRCESEEDDFWKLIRTNHSAFVMLAVIAQRARRSSTFNLESGEALLGDWLWMGFTRERARNALRLLASRGFLTIKTTNKGTIVKIIKSTVFDINEVSNNHQNNQQTTNRQPTDNQQTTTNKNDKNERSNTLSREKHAEDFGVFWLLYPRKIEKADALKAWKVHCCNGELSKIKIALAWQINSEDWTKEDGKFIPYPARYIRRHRWEDEPPKLEEKKAKFVY